MAAFGRVEAAFGDWKKVGQASGLPMATETVAPL